MCLWLWATSSLPAVDFYATGFENFTPGPDRIAGAPATGTSAAIPATDGWTGSHAGQDRSGILAESSHALPGIGNAAYVGGNTAAIFTGGSNIYVRKILNRQPVTEGNEIVTLRALVGLKDSAGQVILTRDNFEILIYNYTPGSSAAVELGGLQFDNSQISTSTGKPYQAVYRYAWDPARQAMAYTATGATFVYDTMQAVEIRINYRTNKWAATLDGVPLFTDLDFYKGTAALNLGSILVKCKVTNTFLPGSNYLLFDDLEISAAAPEAALPPDLTLVPGSGAQLRWWQEAGYRYEIRRTDALGTWVTAAGGAATAATSTGYTGTVTDSSALGIPRRFYKLIRTLP